MKFAMYMVVSIFIAFPPLAAAADYVGSASCTGCHQSIYADWRQSDHFRAMLPVGEQSVYGDFDSRAVNLHGVDYRFFREDGRYLIETGGGVDKQTHEPAYTFGHRPLQQYLIKLAGGRLQALNVAWDNRPSDAGGQRWFHLRDELPADSPFHWSRHLQNWNANCAECHSTGVSKNYDPSSQTYDTTFAEVNVACESCHGPGAEHVTSARSGEKIIPPLNTPAPPLWAHVQNEPVARPTSEPSRAYINMCGGCHARRTVIGDIHPGKPFTEQFQLTLLEGDLYYADGQIRDEVFVLGSYMQSKMYAAGVTCMNCHNPHTGAVRYDGNKLCAQCHAPARYETLTHLRHALGTPGAQCVDCHMPARTYMQVDDRRDHRFGIPDPSLTASENIPNACTNCHQGKSPEWAMAAISQPPPMDRFALINARLRRFDPLAIKDAAAFIKDVSQPVIERATLLANLPPADASWKLAVDYLQSTPELLRYAAVRKLAEAPAAVRRSHLTDMVNDSSLLVRREVSKAMADIVPQASATFTQSLEPRLDTPSAQSELGLLAQRLGRHEDAAAAYERAISIEPHYLPALLNLADLRRGLAEDEKAITLLRQAVQVAPDSSAANHSYALALVRRGQTTEALAFFEAATRQQDRQPRYAYVYAVALDSLAMTGKAIAVLRRASAEWPHQYDLLMLEVLYLEKSGDRAGVRVPLLALAKLAPDAPAVRQRLKIESATENKPQCRLKIQVRPPSPSSSPKAGIQNGGASRH